MEPIEDTWDFAEGDRITPELVAVRRLGGGAAYDAYLAFDEVIWGPVVVKVLRPAQVANPSSLRGLRREVAALEAVNHPVVVRKLRHSLERTGRTLSSSRSTDLGSPRCSGDTAPCSRRSTCHSRSTSPRHCSTSATSVTSTSTSSRAM